HGAPAAARLPDTSSTSWRPSLGRSDGRDVGVRPPPGGVPCFVPVEHPGSGEYLHATQRCTELPHPRHPFGPVLVTDSSHTACSPPSRRVAAQRRRRRDDTWMGTTTRAAGSATSSCT